MAGSGVGRARALGRQLAARCRALQASGLTEAAAEYHTFQELLSSDVRQRPDWPQLCADVYQHYLHACAPDRRRASGVYYTPAAIVGAQVRFVADLLETRLGRCAGFADQDVLTLDPAAGSGAYALAIADLIRQRGGSNDRPQPRMRLFEPTLGAGLLAAARGVAVEQRDALAEPLALDAPIVVCLGNPPYGRGRAAALDGGFVRFGTASMPALLDDFRDPAAGVHGKNLYNAYVYFWRWAVWQVFESRAGPGIVSFITAASYLRGPAFAAMRRQLRETLDELWIVDLEGDRLAARQTDNVFPIRTPVAIAIGIRDGQAQPRRPARVQYARLAGNGPEKLASLDAVASQHDLVWQTTPRAWTCAFVPASNSAFTTFPRLTELFPWQTSGVQVKRTWPIGPTPEVLRERWARLLKLAPAERLAAFRATRDRDLDSSPPDVFDASRRLRPLRELTSGAACIEPLPYAYRSFDRQWLLPDARLGDFLRPSLWRVAGPRQVFLTSLLTSVLGPGPAVVATALVPDLDHFRGSFGARAVIPLWMDAAATRPNVAEGVLPALADRFGCSVTPEMLFSYCYALLATRTYVERFADELRQPGPRVPITRDAQVFTRTAALGARLLSVHTYTRSLPGQACCAAPVGPAYPADFGYVAERQMLRVGDGIFDGVSPRVWDYRVSGLAIVRSWLRQRLGRPGRGAAVLDALLPAGWTSTLTHELLELIWLLEATLDLEPALDDALEAAIASSAVAA